MEAIGLPHDPHAVAVLVLCSAPQLPHNFGLPGTH